MTTWSLGPVVNKAGQTDAAKHWLNWLWNNEAFHRAIAGAWLTVWRPFEDADWMFPFMKKALSEQGKHGASLPPSVNHGAVSSTIPINDYCQGKIATAAEAVEIWKNSANDAISKGA